jgi:hypothetical protein
MNCTYGALNVPQRHERSGIKVRTDDCPIDESDINAKINTHKIKKQNCQIKAILH